MVDIEAGRADARAEDERLRAIQISLREDSVDE
jgi:hypothetical protein